MSRAPESNTPKPQRSPGADILLTVLLAFAIILAIAIYIPGQKVGVIGVGLNQLTKGLLGPVALVLPILIAVIAMTLLVKRKPLPQADLWLHLAFLLAIVAALIHVLTVPLDALRNASYQLALSATPPRQNPSARDSLQVLWSASPAPATLDFQPRQYPGGLMGGMLALGMTRLFGAIGATVVLIAGVLIEAVLLFNFSLTWFFEGAGRVMSNAGERIRHTGRIAAEHIGAGAHTLSRGRNDRIATTPKRWNHEVGTPHTPLEELAEEKALEPPAPNAVVLGSGKKKRVLTYGDTPTTTAPPRTKRSPMFHDIPEIQEPDFYGEEQTISDDGELIDPHHSTQISPQQQVPYRRAQKPIPAPEPDAEDWGDPLDDEVLAHQGVETNASDTPSMSVEAFGHGSAPQEAPPQPRKTVTASVERVKHEQAGQSHIKVEDEHPSRPYQLPPLELLQPRGTARGMSPERAQRLGEKLEQTLASFGVEARVIHITSGPTITRFELTPGPGVKVSRIVNLSDDIALSLAAVGVRIEAPIPGKSAIGIEIPNKETAMVGLRQLLEEERDDPHHQRLMVALGRDIPGMPIYCDIAKMPHLLIAGATGSGKSICINVVLLNILYRAKPDEVKLLLVDPKVVELSIYNGIPHLLAPVVTDPKKAANTLNWAVAEMTRRYGLFATHKVRDLNSYNQRAAANGEEILPLIVLVIDELSDLMVTAAREVEEAIARLTAMARAAGIHLIIATQRPSVDVITGVIKANMPSRIAFAVTSQVDSRTILDQGGAEKLLGKGDMLYYPQSSSKPLRGQGAFVSEEEVEAVVSFIRAQEIQGYDKEVAEEIISMTPSGKTESEVEEASSDEEDELLGEAVEIVIDAGYASVSILQRRLQVGYPRAARLIDRLEQLGHIGPFEGSKPRKVLITRMEWELKRTNQDAPAPSNDPPPTELPEAPEEVKDDFDTSDWPFDIED